MEEVNIFADDMIIHLRDAKNSTRELLKLISNVNKLAQYKINSYKSVAIL